MEVSKRLQKIASLIPQGLRVADIGSDHAYLPTYLVQQGISPQVIAGEVNLGPFESAKKQIELVGLTDQVDVRRGDGLEVIADYEVDVIVIAGMGGALINRILREGKKKLSGIKRLVLQPNVGEEYLRRFGYENAWRLIEEIILEEDEKIYEILIFEPGDGRAPYHIDIPLAYLFKLGPFHIQRKEEVFRKKWMQELMQMKKVVEQLSQSSSLEAERKKEQLLNELAWIREAIK